MARAKEKSVLGVRGRVDDEETDRSALLSLEFESTVSVI